MLFLLIVQTFAKKQCLSVVSWVMKVDIRIDSPMSQLWGQRFWFSSLCVSLHF